MNRLSDSTDREAMAAQVPRPARTSVSLSASVAHIGDVTDGDDRARQPTDDPVIAPNRGTDRNRTGATFSDAPGLPPINRKKSKKAADAERRERHRQAEARIEVERAQRRADNRAARERDAAERAERRRVADATQERARRDEGERIRRAAEAAATRVQRAAAGTDNATHYEPRQRAEQERQAEAARAAERKRLAEVARRAARAERKAERRRAKDDERRATREAVRARALGADPYTILGIASDAPAVEVTRAYRRLARALHPDLHREGTPKERAAREAGMKRVNVAYGLLGDPQRRKAYDRLRGTVRD